MKLSVKKAVKGNNTFDLSSTHLTTMDFGMLQPSYICECVPGDTLHVKMKSFARLAPLAVPTFGNIKCVTRAFFVPMRSIFHGWQEWYDRSNDASLSSTFSTITNDSIVDWFADLNNGLSIRVTKDNKPDFSFISDTTTNNLHFQFTSKGRWLYKVLLSLGYSLNFGRHNFGNGDVMYGDTTRFSVYPMLAFLRVFYDYIYPSQWVNGLGLGDIFEKRSAVTSVNLLSAFQTLMAAPYAKDYFTSAWTSPNQLGPSTNIHVSNINADSPVSNGYVVESGSNTTRLKQNTANANYITSYGLRVLSAVSDFLTRNNIAGSRYFEQLAARFGVSSYMASPNRSIYLKSLIDDVEIMDVTSTATTEFGLLGEQGAKGIQFGSDHQFDVDVSKDSYGYLICISHVMPDVGYFQGRKRHVLHTERFDFYTPEFDKVGLQAIRNDELFADFKDSISLKNGKNFGGDPENVFGFAPRYSEYKKGDDYLTGDFRCPSSNVGLENYHLMRILPQPSQLTPLSLSSDFLLVQQHDYDRIFQQRGQKVSQVEWIPNPDIQIEDIAHFNEGMYQYLGFNGQPIIFHDSSDNIDYVLCYDKNSFQTMRVVARNSLSSNRFLGQEAYLARTYMNPLIVNINATGYGINTFPIGFLLDGMDVGDYIQFQIQGKKFALMITSTVDGSTSLPSGSLTLNGYLMKGYSDNSYRGKLTEDDFDALFMDYFDHFYSIFRYDVKASRPMLSISESMPIDDGGSPQSVDYGGFQFTV